MPPAVPNSARQLARASATRSPASLRKEALLARRRLAASLHLEGQKSAELGGLQRAHACFAASDALQPSLAARLSAANMSLRLGKPREAIAVYEAILEPGVNRSEAEEAMATRKLQEAREKAVWPEAEAAAAEAAPATRRRARPSGAPSLPHARLACDAMDAGLRANAESRPELARALFTASFELGGQMEAKISAVNMALKMGQVEHAIEEYDALLGGPLSGEQGYFDEQHEALVRRKLAAAIELRAAQQVSARACASNLHLHRAYLLLACARVAALPDPCCLHSVGRHFPNRRRRGKRRGTSKRPRRASRRQGRRGSARARRRCRGG